MENNVDRTTGEFVKNNVEMDKEAFDELKQIFPNNNDIRRIDMQHYIEENYEDIRDYIVDGPTADTSPKDVEAARVVRKTLNQVGRTVQDFMGSFLEEN